MLNCTNAAIAKCRWSSQNRKIWHRWPEAGVSSLSRSNRFFFIGGGKGQVQGFGGRNPVLQYDFETSGTSIAQPEVFNPVTRSRAGSWLGWVNFDVEDPALMQVAKVFSADEIHALGEHTQAPGAASDIAASSGITLRGQAQGPAVILVWLAVRVPSQCVGWRRAASLSRLLPVLPDCTVVPCCRWFPRPDLRV